MTVYASLVVTMYNKLFTKILDSSIWLAPDPHRLVWITLIAAMDEDGNAMFACVDNLAARARVSVKQAEAAVKDFEAPDRKSGDQDNDGRRIERIPGGWLVLNAHKYRSMVTKTIIREQTRIRTEKWRASKRGDAPVTQSDETVTTSEALALSKAVNKEARTQTPKWRQHGVLDYSTVKNLDLKWWELWLAHRRAEHRPKYKTTKVAEALAKHPPTVQAAAIEMSMDKGWQGLFPEKLNGTHKDGGKPAGRYEQHTERLRQWLIDNGAA